MISRETEKRFRMRGPCRAIWNSEIPAGKEKAAWKDALDFVAGVKAERLHSFRIEVNLKRDAKKQRSTR